MEMNMFSRPKCPSCGAVLEWGVTTSVKNKVEKCNSCNAVLGED